MKKLAPLNRYRLALLEREPRFYRPDAAVKYLARHGLIELTGQQDPDGARAEYAITEAGREALRQSGLDGGGPLPGH